MKKIVIVGGGFAGINFIKQLRNDKRFEITLVDKNNYHFFAPLLYQVAAAFIEPSNISYPFRRMYQGVTNVHFHMGKLLRVFPESNTIETDTGTLVYDYLVLAVGTEVNYFGMENVKRYALPMKTVDDAVNLRNHILLNMEKAVRATTESEKAKLLTMVIAGGGPTGVEVAGMLAEMGASIAAKEYPEIKDLKSHLYLVDAAPIALQAMSKNAQQEATKVLGKLGVHLMFNTCVTDYNEGKVYLNNGTFIETEVLIWASGVTGREVPGIPKESLGKGRRLLVDAYNQVLNMPGIYAIGDICLQTADKNYPNGHPQLAQVAIQQGHLLAANFQRMEDNKPPVPFVYNNKGSMAIISKFRAVVDLPKGFMKGFVAWFVWLFIHIMPLVGFSNKLKLAFNWMWAFISNNPTLRLIIRPNMDGKDE